MNRTVNADQVAWMLAAIDRYLPPENEPRSGVRREMLKHGLMLEIMGAAGLAFEDAEAEANATPIAIREKGRGRIRAVAGYAGNGIAAGQLPMTGAQVFQPPELAIGAGNVIEQRQR